MENADKSASAPKERLWNRNYCTAMAGNFMLFFSFYLLTPLLPIYLDSQFAADKDMIGLVLSGYVLAALFVRPFSGFVVDTSRPQEGVDALLFLFLHLFCRIYRCGHTADVLLWCAPSTAFHSAPQRLPTALWL